MKKKVLSLIALPVMTLVVFAALAVVSFVELRGKEKEPPSGDSLALSAGVTERYRQESQKLKEIRLEARQDLTPEVLLAGLSKGSKGGLASKRTYVCWFRGLREKDPSAADAVLVGLLPLWKEFQGDEAETQALEIVEELLTQACLCPTEDFALTDAQRGHLMEVAEVAGNAARPVAGAVLLFFAQVATQKDVPALRELNGALRNSRLRRQLSCLIGELAKKELVRA